jgi:hypothetical protein
VAAQAALVYALWGIDVRVEPEVRIGTCRECGGYQTREFVRVVCTGAVIGTPGVYRTYTALLQEQQI